jgi:hypothetical protein
LPEIEDSAKGERTGFSSFGNRLASGLRRRKNSFLCRKKCEEKGYVKHKQRTLGTLFNHFSAR